MFREGQQVYWKVQTGWGGGETRRTVVEVLKVNRVKVRIRAWEWVDGHLTERIKNVLPEKLEPFPMAEKAEDGREKGCETCQSWFLGCLNGRERWKDKAITPNHRRVQLEDGRIDFVCDAFQLDPNKKRKGRVVSDGTW